MWNRFLLVSLVSLCGSVKYYIIIIFNWIIMNIMIYKYWILFVFNLHFPLLILVYFVVILLFLYFQFSVLILFYFLSNFMFFLNSTV